jgi:hypothetical protein
MKQLTCLRAPSRQSKYRVAVLTLLLSAHVSCAAASTSDQTAFGAATGDGLLRAMAFRYASCHSYADNGELSSVLRSDDGRVSTESLTFETVFDRVAGFRFEFMTIGGTADNGAIWRASVGPAHVWWTLKPVVEDEPNVLDAIDWVSGVSSGTARYVPGMLFGVAESVGGRGFQVEGDEEIGGTWTRKLSRHDSGGVVVTLWIGQTDHLLRRLFRRRHGTGHGHAVTEAQSKLAANLGDEERKQLVAETAGETAKLYPYTEETTINYSPVFDGPIEPTRLEFHPPKTTRSTD